MRGSKYYQSVIGSSFKIAKEKLEKNKPVIFSGNTMSNSWIKVFFR